MPQKTIDNEKLTDFLFDIGLANTIAKSGTILASQSAKRAMKESSEARFNRKINRLLR